MAATGRLAPRARRSRQGALAMVRDRLRLARQREVSQIAPFDGDQEARSTRLRAEGQERREDPTDTQQRLVLEGKGVEEDAAVIGSRLDADVGTDLQAVPVLVRVLNEYDRRTTLKEEALLALDRFIGLYQAKYPKACDCLRKDKEDRPKTVDAIAERLAVIEVPAWTSEQARDWWSGYRPATPRPIVADAPGP